MKKKLSLKKTTISNLDNPEMGNVRGGGMYPTALTCGPSDCGCNSFPPNPNTVQDPCGNYTTVCTAGGAHTCDQTSTCDTAMIQGCGIIRP